ncbi:hypothetical protein CLV24_11744 [Pontibacter ummariensis]|uniref:Uncharacterized protein n=1 Tax=Pontibacter ummariensis TaxID=1610492 RepID=A0A239II88_9BACT|nr:hypothetical protein [Pontibacter ummariensis]PRY09840.1 hypothetical protein CLV24_11744 [Pontibacter ummariensis]SNS92733.1 hypothetical protein SAMN06296052_11744 [Pontibacter ummariensis]
MPILLTRQKDDVLAKSQPCDFSDPSLNQIVEQQTTIEEMKKRCDRYKQLLASLQPPQDNTMIRAANFTTDSVLQMIQQSPSSSFIRVYYGIEESGEHVLFMAPVTEAGTLAAEEETIYVDDCCRCPPLSNCPADGLLEEQP